MIQLKNVSKFYYQKGMIATGFTKVNLTFRIGEFVAITGESGSGKSTLLNVISGLDSYEEGEMFVDGLETSHYLEKDWEEYRRKNIGNIYQSFNLINSYTVYQNVELVLSLNGMKRKERKMRVLELLKQVDLFRYKNTKVSKLSGGQKQRVAIARALAKETPVIIADEPTGNLDKRSAASIIELLREISKDKLVIIVTHNYDQVSDYVTRKITMHDGRVIEDLKIKPVEKEQKREEAAYKNLSWLEKVHLSWRNTFNVIPKFILLFLVYAFIVAALMGEYSFFKQGEYETEKAGFNSVFQDTNDKRIILNKKDKTLFSQEELTALKSNDKVHYLTENDAVTDKNISFANQEEDIWLNGSLHSIERIDKVNVGRMPEASNEIVIEGMEEDYQLKHLEKKILDQTYHYSGSHTESKKEYKIVGIVYKDPDTVEIRFSEYRFYAGDEVLKDIQFQTHQEYSTITIEFMGKKYISEFWNTEFRLEPNNWVTPGTAIVSEDFNMYCEKNNCLNKWFHVNVKNMYYEENKDFPIEKLYKKDNMMYLLDLPEYDKKEFDDFYNGKIYINPLDYNTLFDKGTYQISVYAKDQNDVDSLAKELDEAGYYTLKIKDTLILDFASKIIRVIKIIVTIILIVVLFFISYFIIKVILKSRNGYYAVLRMLGASKSVCKHLIIIELAIIANLAYFVFVILAKVNEMGYIDVGFIHTVNRYFLLSDYITLYVIILLMSILISVRYSRKLFQTSVMSAYREEV